MRGEVDYYKIVMIDVVTGEDAVFNSDETAYEVDLLKPATEYRFEVFAITTDGKQSELSISATVTTVEAGPTAPSRPELLELTPIVDDDGSASVGAKWRQPSESSEVTYYNIGIFDLATGEERLEQQRLREFDGKVATNFVIDSLTAGKEYLVRVQAHNGVEGSEYSEAVSVKIPSDLVELVAVENLRVVDLKAESFRIAFDNPNRV